MTLYKAEDVIKMLEFAMAIYGKETLSISDLLYDFKSKEIHEISDEEIEKAAYNCCNLSMTLIAFIEGAKWYREQLKQRNGG